MIKRIKYNKVIYFWFFPFSVGICLSAGYLITHKVFLRSNMAISSTAKYQEDTIKNNNKESDNDLSPKEEIIIIKTNTAKKLLPKEIITINTDSSLRELGGDQALSINLSKTVNQSNRESSIENLAENSLRLKKASSDKLEKIFNKLFQTLPKR